MTGFWVPVAGRGHGGNRKPEQNYQYVSADV